MGGIDVETHSDEPETITVEPTPLEKRVTALELKVSHIEDYLAPKQQQQKAGNSKQKTVKCTFCNKMFKEIEYMKIHCFTAHRDMVAQESAFLSDHKKVVKTTTTGSFLEKEKKYPQSRLPRPTSLERASTSSEKSVLSTVVEEESLLNAGSSQKKIENILESLAMGMDGLRQLLAQK